MEKILSCYLFLDIFQEKFQQVLLGLQWTPSKSQIYIGEA